jgi:hypothetical protein
MASSSRDAAGRRLGGFSRAISAAGGFSGPQLTNLGEWRGRKEEKAYHSVIFRNLSDKYIAVIFRKSSLSLPFLKGNLGGLSGSYW